MATLGAQILDEGYGSDSRNEFGVDLSVRNSRWPVWLTTFGSRSFDSRPCATECGEVHETITQIGVGVRRLWQSPKKSAYVGAGVAWGSLRGNYEEFESNAGNIVRYEYSGGGWWAGGGLLFPIRRHLQLGAGVRYSSLNDVNHLRDMESWSIHGTFGWFSD